MLRELICTVHLTVSHYHVMYEFQSESTFCSLSEYQGTPCLKQAPYLNSNGIRTHNHLVRKRTLNLLAKLAKQKDWNKNCVDRFNEMNVKGNRALHGKKSKS